MPLAVQHQSFIEKLPREVRVRTDVPASTLTTFAVGGIVPLLLEPADISSLQTVLKTLRGEYVPWQVIGAGSNIVISDAGLDAALIRLGREFSGATLVQEVGEALPKCDAKLDLPEPEQIAPDESVLLFVMGGSSLMSLSRRCSALGLSGLEFAAGIPASLGGAVTMNAGAHGHEMSDVVQAAWVLTETGGVQRVEAAQLNFSYRHSAIADGMIVLGAEIVLRAKSPEEVSKERTRCLAYRRRTQPLQLPSAGSVFTNPGVAAAGEEPVYAARLIELLGMKGQRRGGVGFSELHANWLVKLDQSATATDVFSLMDEAKQRVHEQWNIELRPEIIRW